MAPKIRYGALFVFGPLALAGLLVAPSASAEPPWVDRHVVLPEHDWAFGFGVGVAHDYYDPPANNPTGAGLDTEISVSPIDRLEIGIRSGLRIGDDGRATQADQYGRLFDFPTFGTNHDDFANPELRVRGALLRSSIVEIGAEGRLFLPAEHGSEAGIMFGVPFLFHIVHVVRIDTGVYVPVLFYSPVDSYINVPLDVWFQATSRLWLGPITGVIIHPPANHADVPFGFGLGYQVVSFVDLKAQFLFPALNETQGADTFGFGFAVEVRIE
jgi:hypothetical protein